MLASQLIRDGLSTLQIQITDQDVGTSLGPQTNHLSTKTGSGAGDDDVEAIELRDELRQGFVKVKRLVEGWWWHRSQ